MNDTELRRKIMLLRGAKQGSGSKSRVMRQSNLTYSQQGDVLIEDLVERGMLNHIQLRGDRNWVSLSPIGDTFLHDWDRMCGIILSKGLNVNDAI